ncbi:MAG TPA: hypothetical protein VNJ04_18490 [Gemmatimonadaceae bacterium]|nr:hypothetical protein [Gemmatimonadaceae bacterium]
MTDRAVLAILEPLRLAARTDARDAVRNFALRVLDGENVSIDEILDVLNYHARHGYRAERDAFAFAAARLGEASL